MATFWPVIGVLGMGQVGKSTLLRDRLGIENYLTLDDEEIRAEAQLSPRVFLGKNQSTPTVLDEVQKAPHLFDALKALVDRKKVPGRWYLSGSVAFSQKLGIRESLTGRIGLLHLYPLCLAETNQQPLKILKKENDFLHPSSPRFRAEDVAEQMSLGGLPVPAFVRDPKMRTEYWNNWLDTTIARDASRAYGKGFDPDYCFSLIRMLAKALPKGEYPSLNEITGDKRKAKRYIQALENIFFLRRFTIHEPGVGNDHWIFGDAGLAFHLSPQKEGPEVSLSIARHYLLNEIFCLNEYQGFVVQKTFYKSIHGPVIDFVWNGIPIKIIHESIAPSQMEYHSRSLVGAMKALKVKRAVLLAPVNTVHLPKQGVCLLPWGFWS
ncbi:AAA family ATPase [Bdellovibrionota bacterium FG-1]